MSGKAGNQSSIEELVRSETAKAGELGLDEARSWFVSTAGVGPRGRAVPEVFCSRNVHGESRTAEPADSAELCSEGVSPPGRGLIRNPENAALPYSRRVCGQGKESCPPGRGCSRVRLGALPYLG